jgi:hypothetical protein
MIINLLIIFGIIRNFWRNGKSVFVPVLRRLIKQTVVTIQVYDFHQLLSKLYPPSCSQG